MMKQRPDPSVILIWLILGIIVGAFLVLVLMGYLQLTGGGDYIPLLTWLGDG